MLQEQSVKEYFSKKGSVIKWWRPGEGVMAPIYAREFEIIKDLLENESLEEILEVSCGQGRLTRSLCQLYKVVALDISEEMLSILKSQRLPNVSIVKGDAENLPFKDNTFSCIICVKSFLHYPNPQKAIAEFYRVLKKNGVLILDIDNKYSLRWLIKNLILFFYKVFHPNFKRVGEGIFQLHSECYLKKLIKQGSFHIERIRYLSVLSPISIELQKKKLIFFSPNFYKKVEFLDKFLETSFLFRKMSSYVYVKCRK